MLKSIKMFYCFLYFPLIFSVCTCTDFIDFGIANIFAFSLFAQRILFLVYEKFVNPLEFLFKSLGARLNPSIGPLDSLLIISSLLLELFSLITFVNEVNICGLYLINKAENSLKMVERLELYKLTN